MQCHVMLSAALQTKHVKHESVQSLAARPRLYTELGSSIMPAACSGLLTELGSPIARAACSEIFEDLCRTSWTPFTGPLDHRGSKESWSV